MFKCLRRCYENFLIIRWPNASKLFIKTCKWNPILYARARNPLFSRKGPNLTFHSAWIRTLCFIHLFHSRTTFLNWRNIRRACIHAQQEKRRSLNASGAKAAITACEYFEKGIQPWSRDKSMRFFVQIFQTASPKCQINYKKKKINSHDAH